GTGSRTVFKMTPAGTLTVLSNVGGEDGDRAAPGLTLGSDGNFYGATGSGGSQGAGTVFQITPRGKLTVLYSFSSDTGNGYPDAGPTQGADGNLYGTTMIGDGTFQSPISTPALHPLPSSIVAGDFNGDGNLDVAMTNLDAGWDIRIEVDVLLGMGDG